MHARTHAHTRIRTVRREQIAVHTFAEGRVDSFSFFSLSFSPDARSMDSPGQFAIDIKEFAGRIVALEALGKPAKSPVPRVTGPEICALVSRAPMYRERLGGIKGMRPLDRYLFSRDRPSSTCRAISWSGLSAIPQDHVAAC